MRKLFIALASLIMLSACCPEPIVRKEITYVHQDTPSFLLNVQTVPAINRTAYIDANNDTDRKQILLNYIDELYVYIDNLRFKLKKIASNEEEQRQKLKELNP